MFYFTFVMFNRQVTNYIFFCILVLWTKQKHKNRVQTDNVSAWGETKRRHDNKEQKPEVKKLKEWNWKCSWIFFTSYELKTNRTEPVTNVGKAQAGPVSEVQK